MPPLAALQAATVVNAQMLRRDQQIGRIAPGFEADVVVVERNPIDQISTLQDPLLVMTNGRIALNRTPFGLPRN